jgi:hypothetical protein
VRARRSMPPRSSVGAVLSVFTATSTPLSRCCDRAARVLRAPDRARRWAGRQGSAVPSTRTGRRRVSSLSAPAGLGTASVVAPAATCAPSGCCCCCCCCCWAFRPAAPRSCGCVVSSLGSCSACRFRRGVPDRCRRSCAEVVQAQAVGAIGEAAGGRWSGCAVPSCGGW